MPIGNFLDSLTPSSPADPRRGQGVAGSEAGAAQLRAYDLAHPQQGTFQALSPDQQRQWAAMHQAIFPDNQFMGQTIDPQRSYQQYLSMFQANPALLNQQYPHIYNWFRSTQGQDTGIGPANISR